MNVSQFFPSKYVKAPDLNGREVTVEIDRVAVEKVGVPPKVEEKLVMYFRKATKGMILNKVNAMTIAAMYSPETDNWTGRRVTLYPTRVQAFGATHEVIRIKPQEPPKSTAAPEPPHFDDAEDVIDNEDVDDVMATGTPAPPPPPAQPEPEPSEVPFTHAAPAAEEDLAEFHAIGGQLYGDDWPTVCTRNVLRVTGSRTDDDAEMSETEVRRLIAGMKALEAKRNQPDAKLQKVT